jgi:Hint module
MENLSIGDRVLTYDSETGRFRFDAVVAFIHRSSLAKRGTIYQTIETDGGHRLTLTPGWFDIAAYDWDFCIEMIK